MNELELVVLIKEYKSLPIGTKGRIIHKYSNDLYMVEFYNKYGIVASLYTVTLDYLELTSK